MVQIKLDAKGYLIAISQEWPLEGGVFVAEEMLENVVPGYLCCYQMTESGFVFDKEKFETAMVIRQQNHIRECRERECFPVINRGKAWYNSLSEEQGLALELWYRAWLDAPLTGAVPEPLSFT